MRNRDMLIDQADGSVIDYDPADGYGAIRMVEKPTIPERQCYARGFNAGSRNRRLCIGLPRDPKTHQPLGVHAFDNEAYGTGYHNGWREADIRINRGTLKVLPCAEWRSLVFAGGE